MQGAHTAGSADLPMVQDQVQNINDLIDRSCQHFAERPALGMAFESPLTYRQLHDRILLLAAYLSECGVRHGDRVAILAENSHNWGTVYLAIVRLGGICVPMLPDLPEADVHHILDEMECSILFTTQRQIEKIYDFRKPLTRIITLDEFDDPSGVIHLLPFSLFLKEAEEQFADQLAEGKLTFPRVEQHQLASILYTSGTSGFSKAVMLSHANLCANAFSTSQLLDLRSGAIFLSVLPISHTYEFTVGFLLPLIIGGKIVYAGRTPTPAILQKICSIEQPHVMLIVPLIMEKIYKKRVLPAVEKSALLSWLCRFSPGRKLIYRKIGSKLLAFFGGRLEVMGIGGAALNPEVELFLRDAGFPYIVGYGLTESSPLIAGGPQHDPNIRLGSTGKPIPRVEVKIDNPDPCTGIGEILARGPNIMQGYWNDPEATNETITDEGWLRTGDLGMLDDLGNLHVKGRLKSVIVMANGENVYPEVIEHKLNSYPFVLESLVIENQGKLEAWVYPDYDLIDEETQGQSRQQRHAYLSSLLEEMRRELNSQLGPASRLSRVIERREPFIKTATHKIKRYLYAADKMQV